MGVMLGDVADWALESVRLGNTNITMLFFNGSVIRNAIESVHAYYKQNRYI